MVRRFAQREFSIGEPSATARVSGSARRLALVVLVGLAGVLAVHHPMILSEFGRIQTDLGDTRLLNYFLEHGWLWVSRAPGHERFWDAPFFHPVPNVMAFSDCMLGYGPFYWPLRAAGLAPDTAFGVWMVAMTALNYAAGALLFHRGLGFGAPATAAAAGLIAFGSPRVNQLNHPQLLPSFYLLLALHALCRIAREPAAGAIERAWWWVLFGLAVATQFYGGYYLGWFFVVGLAVATLAALLLPSTRGRVASLAKRERRAAALGATVAAVALLPFLARYLPVAREFGQDLNDFQKYVQPTGWAWWNVGEANWLWGWIDHRWPVGTLFPGDFRLGVGFATTAACGLGAYLGRRHSLCRVALAATLFGVAAMTLSLAHLGAAAACFVLGRLCRKPRWTGWDAASFALATVAPLAAPSSNDVALSLAFVMMAFCLLRIWTQRGRKGAWAAPAAALVALGLHSLPMEAALLLVGPCAAAGAWAVCLSPGRRAAAAFAALCLWLAAAAWMAVESEPWIFGLAALGTAFGWWASGSHRFRAGPVSLLVVLAIALPLVIAACGSNSLWLAASPFIPGSEAIRVPPRVVLALLIPAALGLAMLVERLDRNRRSAAAWCLVILCLAEQTGTTATFDRDASRRRVAEVARRVDRRAEAFYERPPGRGDFYYHVHLDAMWASLETGVPTINGVSGCFPTGWRDLEEPSQRAVEDALRQWRDRHGLQRARIQIIDHRADETAPKSAEVSANRVPSQSSQQSVIFNNRLLYAEETRGETAWALSGIGRLNPGKLGRVWPRPVSGGAGARPSSPRAAPCRRPRSPTSSLGGAGPRSISFSGSPGPSAHRFKD